MNHNTKTSRVNLACLIAARLCLIVSLWQAPIPWLHCHDTDIAEMTSTASADELSTHLAIYHSSVDLNLDRELGWHFHWVLPFWNHLFDETSKEDLPLQNTFAFDSATISVTQLVCSDSPLLMGEVNAGWPTRSQSVWRSYRLRSEISNSFSHRKTFSFLRC